MKKGLLLLLVCFAAATTSFAQNVWVFGHNVGIDFNSGNPQTVLPPPQYWTHGGSASVCDPNGKLMFYTDGTTVWDSTYNPMPHGYRMFGSECTNVTHNEVQPAVIVPMPDSSTKYYVFSLEQWQSDCTYGTFGDKGRLWYSVVDMNLNNGLGDVDTARKLIVIDSFLADKMAPVLGDRCNIWIMTRDRRNNNWKAFEVNALGVNPTPVVSTCGSFANYTTWNSPTDTINCAYLWATIKFSPDRKRMVCASNDYIRQQWTGFSYHGMELFDFDPLTGIVSNSFILDSAEDYQFNCFSPDGSKIYGSGWTGIYQWDLSLPTAGAIISSKSWIGQNTYWGNVPADMKVAPNGKIYTYHIGYPYTLFPQIITNRYLHVIDQPNLPNVACQFMFDAVQLLPNPTFNPYNPVNDQIYGTFGLPNEIVYLPRDTIKDSSSLDITVCFQDSVLLPVDTSGWDYIWDDGFAGPVRWATQNGNYVVHFHTPPCTHHSDTFRVVINSVLPDIAIKGVNCSESGHIAIIAPKSWDTAAYSYNWYDSLNQLVHSATNVHADTLVGTGAGSYTVRFSNSLGCDTVLAFYMPAGITPGLINNDSSICKGDAVQFSNTSSGTVNFYQWDFNDGSPSVYTAQASHVFTQAGVFEIRLIVADTSIPCYDTVYSMIVVDSTPYLHMTAQNDSLCEGKAMFFAVDYLSGIDSLVWDFGDGLWTSLPLQNSYAHAYDTSGVMVVTAIAKYPNCPDVSAYDSVYIKPFPQIDLGPDTFMCPNGDPILIGDYRNQSDPSASWLWNTGDTTAFIYLRHPGVYTSRIVKDGCGSSDSIEVFKDCYIDVPNAFTPDGDGINDYFLPRQLLSKGLTEFRMQIFNRWGQLIFETNKIDGRGWDGKFNGVDQPQGVFVYLIDAGFKNGANERYQGNVTLIR